MGTPFLPTLALLSSILPSHHGQTETQRYLTPAWHVDATRDRFTGTMQCRLYQGSRKRPAVAYSQGAMAFQFARRLDTTKASFRVDNGTVEPWTAVYPQLIATGARLAGRRMDNPTEGRVLLPTAIMAGAHTVTIRPTPRRRPKAFGIDGFGDALAAARNQGCDPATGFVS